jgi:cytochrome b
MSHTIRVWDLPTRVFHWALLVCVIGLVVTGQIGGAMMDWHFRFGYGVLSLLLFRLVWGLLGGRWSRFASFVYSPATLLRYLRGQATPESNVGHNPLGALSVFAMLLFLLLQIGSGLISDDEIATSGPLTSLVSSSLVSQATWYHRAVGKPILVVLMLLHVAAIVFYLWRKRENLIRPMVLGDKELAVPVPASRDDGHSRLLALVLFLGCIGLVWWLLQLAPAGY